MKIEIETKYSLGDKVWICSYGEAKETEIACVHIAVYLDRVSYYYELVGRIPVWNEADIFPTKDECEKAMRDAVRKMFQKGGSNGN